MKAKFTFITLLLSVTLLTNCKKNGDVQPSPDAPDGTDLTNAGLAANVATNTVTTIAGGTPGLQDGTGKNARFNNPYGIQYAADCNIYVADRNNNKLRKVTPQGVVTTLAMPQAGGTPLDQPEYVAVSKTGLINVIDSSPDGFSECLIFNPDGTLNFAMGGWYAIFGSIAKDPYHDYFWFGRSGGVVKFLVSDDRNYIGTDAMTTTNDFLEAPERDERHWNWTAIAVGYNNVFYLAYGNHLYKRVPSGHAERIFRDLDLGGITSIALSKDSRTIYLAAGGYIKRIDNGKLTVIAGPNGSNQGNDGVGLKADVYANSLAIGQTENEIYFSDPHINAIRKITFK
jgi:hypothetical protein